MGQPREAVDVLRRSMRLSPSDPMRFRTQTALGWAFVLLEEFDRAIEEGQRALESNPNYTATYRLLASELARAGRVDEARDMVGRLFVRMPNLSLLTLPERIGFKQSGKLELIIDGLRAAGFPD